MKICVFAGPTVSAEEVFSVCEADTLPPAEMGDVINAVKAGYDQIAIIDGYFDGRPSVWHKEVLWALDQGVSVFGSASIGALRAAEMHSFGMVGIGRIFEDFVDGHIEDDDEVALIHGPAELGYLPLSVPMVNIRSTLSSAQANCVISRETMAALIDFAKLRHFSHRNWDPILDHALQIYGDEHQAGELARWIDDNYVDQKKIDALLMLQALSDPPVACVQNFKLEWTVMWDKALSLQQQSYGQDTTNDILNELRLTPGLFAEARRCALARFLASENQRSAERSPSGHHLQKALARLRRDRALLSRSRLEDWLAVNQLDASGLKRLLGTEYAIEAAEKDAGAALDQAMIDELKLAGRFDIIYARAVSKRVVLTARAATDATTTRLPPFAMLLEWFTQETGGRADASNADDLVRKLALPDLAALERVIADEFLFRKSDPK